MVPRPSVSEWIPTFRARSLKITFPIPWPLPAIVFRWMFRK
jgi:hypothetical protein